MNEVFSLRVPRDALRRLRRLARTRKTGATQLARAWILERLALEEGSVRPSAVAAEPSAAYRVQRRPPLPQEASEEIAAICSRRGVRRLALFGSAARGELDAERSDLDFAVEFQDMPLGLRPDAYFGLIEDLEALFGRRIDLIELTASTNPYLRASIEADLVTLYDAA